MFLCDSWCEVALRLRSHLSTVQRQLLNCVFCQLFLKKNCGAFWKQHQLFEWTSLCTKNAPKTLMQQIVAQSQERLALRFLLQFQSIFGSRKCVLCFAAILESWAESHDSAHNASTLRCEWSLRVHSHRVQWDCFEWLFQCSSTTPPLHDKAKCIVSKVARFTPVLFGVGGE